ncbi:hypothetical protein TNCV_1581281 [Trichonephila clavipes]|nr:hypothetical protein TNCV_1581281 [Trichonephila clavipes]
MQSFSASQLIDQVFYEDKITPSISTLAFLKYYGVTSSVITLTAHNHETKTSALHQLEAEPRVEFEK